MEEVKEMEPSSVLGLLWDKKSDTLCCDLCDFKENKDEPVTKRSMLSAAHKLFDPIGFTCPITLKPKILLQQSWKLQSGWDSILPEEISVKFLKWKQELPLLAEVKIPR